MKKVTCFYLEKCPYCIQAKKALDELIDENPDYGQVEIDWIEESRNPEIIDQYDYYATPSMFIGQEKLYEAYLFETYEECKTHVKGVLDQALAR